ncbi:MBL fold metallo-hydrolase [Vibrio mangrovi]|uniref:MBL fold metallo-hydrolase n=1 Tax=Vibrio mangrovi TaxID=474394 RepID=A0A1Y6IWW8_9VIBR|nr:MBL fold metallo-hydrolase [Vibrio mangrovi]MDW6005413.1 MBL fold metallo-hydrolase [Vibrio mangrovi]SMS02147.1 metal-dependent hydrolase [Vibrio mangrovi]
MFKAETALFLKPEVRVEALVNQWYAWLYTVSPAAAARYLVQRQIPLLKSYIKMPKLHTMAARSPRLEGGNFVDLAPEYLDECCVLLDQLLAQKDAQVLSDALLDLNRLLQNHPSEHSLSELYSDIPASLKGYVELTYDMFNNLSYRLMEALLYQSEYYRTDRQSLSLSIDHQARAFTLSTPRIADSGYHWPVAFRDKRVDRLFQTELEPLTWSEIKALLSVSEKDEEQVRKLFTDEQRFLSPEIKCTDMGLPDKQGSLRCHYFGHACVLVEAQGKTLLVDPVISYYDHSDPERLCFRDLPEHIDYVLITHGHMDHLNLETLLRIRYKVGTVVVPATTNGQLQDPSMKLMLENCGFNHVVALDNSELITFAEGFIQAVPFFGEHADLNIQAKCCYLISIGEQKVMFAADTCNVEPALYQHFFRLSGKVDYLFVGMESEGAPTHWIYEPVLADKLSKGANESRRLNGSNAIQAEAMVKDLGCEKVFIYALGLEPWLSPLMGLTHTEDSKQLQQVEQFINSLGPQGIDVRLLSGTCRVL